VPAGRDRNLRGDAWLSLTSNLATTTRPLSRSRRSPTLSQGTPLPRLVIEVGQPTVTKRRHPAAAVAEARRSAHAPLPQRRTAPLTNPNSHEPNLPVSLPKPVTKRASRVNRSVRRGPPHPRRPRPTLASTRHMNAQPGASQDREGPPGVAQVTKCGCRTRRKKDSGAGYIDATALFPCRGR
jgi:hypothetical protein